MPAKERARLNGEHVALLLAASLGVGRAFLNDDVGCNAVFHFKGDPVLVQFLGPVFNRQFIRNPKHGPVKSEKTPSRVFDKPRSPGANVSEFSRVLIHLLMRDAGRDTRYRQSGCRLG